MAKKMALAEQVRQLGSQTTFMFKRSLIIEQPWFEATNGSKLVLVLNHAVSLVVDTERLGRVIN